MSHLEEINRIERSYRELSAQGREILKLFLGNPNDHGFLFPPKVLEEVYGRYLSSQEYHPHPKGILSARKAIQQFYDRRGARVDPENILITSGTSESFLYLFSLLAKPGDNLLTPCPAYPLFDPIASMTGVLLRHYPLQEEAGWSVDIGELRSKTDSRTRGILLVSPNNPTGSVVSSEQIREIAEWANQTEIPLICDEVFSEFYFGHGLFPRAMNVASPKLCFTLNGISKMFALPGLKLSWIAVTGEKSKVSLAVDRLETIADTFLSCHIPIQQALPSLFEEGENFLKGYREKVNKRRELSIAILSRFAEVRWIAPQGGFYLMAEVIKPLGISEEDFVIRLMREKSVFVHPGYFYDYEKGIHFVISFLTEEKRLQQGLQAVCEFIRLI